ncbi:F-box and leucine-rich repeat protein 13-like isoform X2 [Ptychodera flava]|uniref:F-box and leucine-rich repeat protein 13-like isoform X2 n=1 Tax=Ptychodera flava TaxID=63121 RepID=UPI003969DEC6
MASLKGVNPELRKYLRKHRLPDVFESIITGLAVICPDDPLEFIAEKLREFMTMRNDPLKGLESVKWDTMIPEELKPKIKPVTALYIDNIFNLDDENLQPWERMPTPEQYAKAYQHYNNKLISICFGAWRWYHERKVRKRIELARKMAEASLYHALRLQRVHLHKWVDWFTFRKARQALAYAKIEQVFHTSLSRLVFEAWHNVMLDSRRTREYFERLERGELGDDDDHLGPRGEARDDISMLPRRAAVKIFSYVDISDLGRCAMVCRSWKMITMTSSLWSRLDLHTVRNKVTDQTVITLLNKCRPYLIHLNLRGCAHLNKPSFITIGQCRNLQDLNISECTGVNDDMMKEIAEGCSTLLYLNMSHTLVSDATLRVLARCCTNLQYLSLAYCKRFSDKGLQYLANGRGCRKLIYLDLSGCTQITVDGYRNVSNGCSNVQAVYVNDNNTIRDECIAAITQKCHNIRAVSLLGAPHLGDPVFKGLAVNRRLQRIRMEGNNRISDIGIKHLAKYCHDLRHVYLADCPRLTDVALKSLSTCRNINVLNIADCVRISDTGVRQMVEGPSGPKIREMNLTNCVRVSDVSILRIMQKCHNLTYASFCFCEHITDAGVELLGSMPSLMSLDISGCSVSDSGLASLGNNPRLLDVTIAECFQITDLGIQKFAQQCRDLERLDVSHCSNLTDSAIKNLAFCCRRLVVLNLTGCYLLTDLSIQYLSGVCHYLHSLDISGCVHVSDKSLRYLRKGCKRMRVLIMLYCRNVSKTAFQKLQGKIKSVTWNNDDPPTYFFRKPSRTQIKNPEIAGSGTG